MEGASIAAIEGNKKSKPKGVGHELRFDILDDVNIKAEMGWEEEDVEYWTSKLCRKYVKMYHIGKLWPRECHPLHTREYCFKPSNCLNEHFVHRSMEVWKALFPGKAMSKGKINYSLAGMVYAELILGRKVDWSTYPTVATLPLAIGKHQKHIPDKFVPKVQLLEASEKKKASEGIVESIQIPHEIQLRRTEVVNGKKMAVEPASTGDPTKGSSSLVDGVEGEIFLTPPTDLNPTQNVLEGVSKINIEMKLPRPIELGSTSMSQEHQEEDPIKNIEDAKALQDVKEAHACIDKFLSDSAQDIMFYVPPSPSSRRRPSLVSRPENAIPTLPNQNEEHPTQPTDARTDSQGEAPVNNDEENPIFQEHPLLALLGPEDLDTLRKMPPLEEMENLLQCSLRWSKFEIQREATNGGNEGTTANEGGTANGGGNSNEGGTTNEGRNSTSGNSTTGFGEIFRTAYSLSCTARVVAVLTPALAQITDTFTKMTPSVLNGALAFRKFVEFVDKLQDEKLQDLKDKVVLEQENEELREVRYSKEDHDDLKAKYQILESKYSTLYWKKTPNSKPVGDDYESVKKENETLKLSNENLKAMNEKLALELKTCEEMLEEHRKTLLTLQNEKAGQQSHGGIGLLEASEPTQESDQLSLPLDKGKSEHGFRVELRQRLPSPKSIVFPLFEDASTQTQNPEVKELRHQLHLALRGQHKAESAMERMMQVGVLSEILPIENADLRWMVWARQLQDRSSVSSRLMKGLLRYALQSDSAYANVKSSYERFVEKLEEEKKDPDLKLTVWGNMDRMYERLNHGKTYDTENIDWALEPEEGCVPYGTLSAHFHQHEKEFVPGSFSNTPILEGHCSLCQGSFGPEGALALGQCRHTFHVYCIQRSAEFQRRCPECRIPLSPRLYEMLGILHRMPTGHEYNRWNLPLDQEPYQFQNYLHWGKPMKWDAESQMYELGDGPMSAKDKFFWMTSDVEVELRAFEIKNDESRELFCRSMGGHWSIQHQKFFRIPEREWRRGPNDLLLEVELHPKVIKQLEGYNMDLIGRALILSKLEEAARVRSVVDLNGKSSTEHKMEDVARAFDMRMKDNITKWRKYLGEGGEEAWMMINEDEIIKQVISAIDCAVRALEAHEIELSPKRKNKRKIEEEDDHSPETKRQFERVDMQVQAGCGGRSGGSSPQAMPRRTSRRLLAREGTSRAAEEDK